MPTPTIPAGNLYMNATLYTGTGATQSVANGASGASFQPDLVWIRNRPNASGGMFLDSVRGSSVFLQTTNANGNASNSGDFVSFNTNGFSVGNNGNLANESGSAFVGWNWKAGSTAVTNNVGSISSQVSANTTAGFSVVTWVGNGVTSATVGHGLGAVPALIICKEYSVSGDYWHVKHQSTASNTNLYLNTTLGSTSAASVGDGVLADLTSSTTFGFATAGSPGNVVAVNESGVSNVAYCWSQVAGYSAFGSYTGNGSADGPFIYTGFRPRWFMIKATDVESWELMDTSRSPYNQAINLFEADSASAEAVTSVTAVDFLSNGFKLRNTRGALNGSGRTYTYSCFAENPFKYANAR